MDAEYGVCAAPSFVGHRHRASASRHGIGIAHRAVSEGIDAAGTESYCRGATC
jgi:hypothetical protein